MTVTINTAQVITALNLLQQRTTHLQPAFEQIGAAIQNHITLDYGSYGSNSSVTPVPEPEEWAMMMLGLPLLGFVGRRKKSDKDFKFHQYSRSIGRLVKKPAEFKNLAGFLLSALFNQKLKISTLFLTLAKHLHQFVRMLNFMSALAQ